MNIHDPEQVTSLHALGMRLSSVLLHREAIVFGRAYLNNIILTINSDTSDKSENPVDSIREELWTLRLDLTALHRRIDAGEFRPPSWNQAEASHVELDRPFLHQHVTTVGTTSSDTSPAAIGITRDTAPRTFEVQNAFAEVRDKYSGSKLPADLLFTTSRKNVKSEDTPLFQVLSKVSKYCETGLKILSDTDRSGRETKKDTVIALTALMRYIQDEGVQLVVNKNYDKEWASQYGRSNGHLWGAY